MHEFWQFFGDYPVRTLLALIIVCGCSARIMVAFFGLFSSKVVVKTNCTHPDRGTVSTQ